MRNNVFLFISLLFLITACGGQVSKDRVLYSGSEGLIMSFPKQNNFQQFANDEFSIALELKNDGAWNVTDGYLSAVFDHSILSFKDSKPVSIASSGAQKELLVSFRSFGDAARPGLEGRSLYNTQGQIDYVDLTFKVLALPGSREATKAPITFYACYEYRTTFVKNACVDRDFFSEKATPVCLASTIIDASQGAPIAVSSVEPRFYRNGDVAVARYKVTIRNLQNGYTMWASNLNAATKAKEICTVSNSKSSSSDNFKEQFGRVYVTAKIGTVDLVCGIEKDGIVRFDGKTAELMCESPQTSTNKGFQLGPNYEAPLQIDLHYFYISTLTANVEVKRE